ncbi:DNA cytosine methyltransferase [Alkalicoccus saliphilus]|uniref:Cytosine-specific methyltransferase n=1 Tax=Alkalicoccus saliphilus TaxID=200989 RepID=A0A2T4U1Y3_9BACI|nr:DNA cytosine methyltransferase [Alkalicoccus saliphilus]PTL37411.1 DNA (cytosine-5-)-methyltransferase [Alkalicoccus saliphilus]
MYKFISLFSGCGGMDLGFKGGFSVFGEKYERNLLNPVWANDIFPQAIETYKKNFGDHMVKGDIQNILDSSTEIFPPDIDVVIGGFPCQDFSVAGKRQGITVKRGRLYLQMKRVIERTAPKIFVAENVEGLINMNGGVVLNTIKNDLSSIIHDDNKVEYDVKHFLLHAADYGVPQVRKRVFIVGVRRDVSGEFTLPKPTHVNKWKTAKEAIEDLWGKEEDLSIPNHNQISRAKFYPGRRMQGNSRIKADKPSVTIRAEHHGNIEAHYNTYNSENEEDMRGWRRLTVRECARIQSFPDDFVFLGSATQTYKQIGNAVPPVLGWHVARAVQNVLLKNDRLALTNHSDKALTLF